MWQFKKYRSHCQGRGRDMRRELSVETERPPRCESWVDKGNLQRGLRRKQQKQQEPREKNTHKQTKKK